MPEYPPENAYFLRSGDIVNVGIDLPDKTFAEDVATVVTTESGGILLNLCGSGFPKHLPIIAGSRIVITRGEGRSLFHSTAFIKDLPVKSSLKIEFPKQVTVRERREYMRADVMVSIRYYIPKCQEMGRVISEWNGLKSCQEECAKSFSQIISSSACRANLNGSGLRFKINDCLPYGTLLHLKIELPEETPDHIHAVGTIVRTKELIPEMDHVEYYSSSMSLRMVESNDRLKMMRHILAEQHRNSDKAPPGYL